MIVVADASVLVTALTQFNEEGNELRTWLSNLSQGGPVDIVQNLTKLEFLSALRRLNLSEAIGDDLAEDAIRNFGQLPHRAHGVTQPMAIRAWELRENLTVCDAAYVALVEKLLSTEGEALLATSDAKLAKAPGLSIPIETFIARPKSPNGI